MDSIPTISYVLLAILLLAALASLGLGLRQYWERIGRGQPWFGSDGRRADLATARRKFNAVIAWNACRICTARAVRFAAMVAFLDVASTGCGGADR